MRPRRTAGGPCVPLLRSARSGTDGTNLTRFTPVRERGVSLVELVIFIVVIGIALSSVAGALAFAGRHSGDPLVQRQALAVAESLLQEVLAQPFVPQNPDGSAEAPGPEAGEARGSATSPFNHVNDYHGYTMTGIVDLGGTPVAGLAAFGASVAVANVAFDGIAAADILRVQVTVTGPGGAEVTLTGLRARQSP
jgi:MSHA pilin protein MshD